MTGSAVIEIALVHGFAAGIRLLVDNSGEASSPYFTNTETDGDCVGAFNRNIITIDAVAKARSIAV